MKVDRIAVVRCQMESLAAEEKFHEHELTVKEEFKDIYEAIPHFDKLPTDVYCQIKLNGLFGSAGFKNGTFEKWLILKAGA